ncbi:MAG: HAMP domain-containing sensor histidine kinase, partial [Bacteroidota bacterium]
SKTYKKKIQIWVVDSGTGISKDILPKVTNPFFTTKEVGKGTGLGLSITQNIIDEHGGELKIKSKLGVGSKFVLSFPRFNK